MTSHVSFTQVKIGHRTINFSTKGLAEKALDISFRRDPKGKVIIFWDNAGLRGEIRQGCTYDKMFPLHADPSSGELIGTIENHHYSIIHEVTHL